MYTGVWWGNLKERDHLEDPDVGGIYRIKIYLQEVGCGCKKWIELAQGRYRWGALVNAVMYFRFP